MKSSKDDIKATDFSGGFKTFYAKDVEGSFEFRSAVDNDKIKAMHEGLNFYEITFNNLGGLVMPIILEWTYEDGTKEIEKVPAEIWRKNESQVSKIFAKEKEVVNITIDPFMETADVEPRNNNFPKIEAQSQFEKYKESNK